MSVVCIIQARMGSSRLPGKVMMPLAGKPALWHVVTRVALCREIDKIVVATTTLDKDQAIADYCEDNNWLCFRGDENDVLDRYYQAAIANDSMQVVRVTSDCPLINPDVLEYLVREFRRQSVDYISTNYPERRYPVGYDCEIMSMDKLSEINIIASSQYDREHVTPYFYNNPGKYKLGTLQATEDLSDIRITLDTMQDYKLLTNLFNSCFSKEQLINLDQIRNFYNQNIAQ